MKILVVEDEFVSRTILTKILSAQGECHVAVNGQEAVDACKIALDEGEPYDLICLDIMMPELDGQAALGQIRELETEYKIRLGDGAKVVMTTALGGKDSIMRAFRETCDGYLIKPFERAALMELLVTLGLKKENDG